MDTAMYVLLWIVSCAYILKTSDHYCKFCEKYNNTDPEICLHVTVNTPVPP